MFTLPMSFRSVLFIYKVFSYWKKKHLISYSYKQIRNWKYKLNDWIRSCLGRWCFDSFRVFDWLWKIALIGATKDLSQLFDFDIWKGKSVVSTLFRRKMTASWICMNFLRNSDETSLFDLDLDFENLIKYAGLNIMG